MKRLLSLFFISVYSLGLFSCSKFNEISNQESATAQEAQSTSVSGMSTSSKSSLATSLSQSADFKLYLNNLKKARDMAFTSVYSNSYIFQSDPVNSSFMQGVDTLSSNNVSGAKQALNSQFAKGDSIYIIMTQNVAVMSRIRQAFPQIFNASSQDRDDIITDAVHKVTTSNPNLVATTPCVQGCDNQYYIAAAVCTVFVETGPGAVICFLGALGGLSACKTGCGTADNS